MSDLLKAILLGIVQGLTEFLPISSTGHLIITEKALGVSPDDFGLRFDAAIHLGTLTAVLVYYRNTFIEIIRDVLSSIRLRDWDVTANSRLGWLLVIGTIPAGIAGLLLQSKIEDSFRSPALVAVMLIVFSLPMWLAEKWQNSSRTLERAQPLDGLLLGIAQSIALIPGVSRSGITISAGMFRGFRRPEAATFAFLLSAPIILAAGAKQMFDIARGGEAAPGLDNEYAVYAAGLITAGVVGYASIAFLLSFLRGNPLTVFIGYRLGLGTLVLVLVAAGVL